MKKASIIKRSALVLAILGQANIALAEDWTRSVALGLGSKQLDSRLWQRADEQDSISLIADIGKASWPVSIAVDLHGTGIDKSDSADPYEGYTAELHLGVRRAWDIGGSGFQFYAGGGLAFGYAETKFGANPELSGDGRGTGYWAGLGLRYRINQRFSVGTDFRYADFDIKHLDDSDTSGSRQFSITGTYHW